MNTTDCHQEQFHHHEASCHHETHSQPGNHYLKISSLATIHCLIGCSVGEFLGLIVGVFWNLPTLFTVVLATILAFLTGFLLTLIPLMKHKGMTLTLAFQTIWLGEVISIGVMEIAMNITDYLVGGMNAVSPAAAIFWYGFAAALIAGFIAAWPVNYFMVKKNLKQCH